MLSCTNDTKTVIDVSNISIDFQVKRFDLAFYKASSKTLSKVKKKYPLFFPSQTPDSVWISKMNDPDEQELFLETQKVYANFSDVKTQLTTLFQHINYYNPSFKAPTVITVLTNIDYENRVVYADSLLLISLDVYLGKTHRFYNGYPSYIKHNNHKNHIVIDVANTLISKQFKPIRDRRFIYKMIEEGKKQYILNRYLPNISEEEKWGIPKEKLVWAQENEMQIWQYFIEKKVLYSSERSLEKRFLDLAPFSKFYLSQDNMSPGRIGVWMGAQIVTSYMNKHNVSLQELIRLDAQELFNKSMYKPKK